MKRCSSSCLRRRSERVGGSTLTCAPVSTRKESLLERSVMCNRRHVSRPDVSVAANGWPARFARLTVFHSGKVECISLRYHQTFGDTSNWDCLEGLGWVDDFGLTTLGMRAASRLVSLTEVCSIDFG